MSEKMDYYKGMARAIFNDAVQMPVNLPVGVYHTAKDWGLSEKHAKGIAMAVGVFTIGAAILTARKFDDHVLSGMGLILLNSVGLGTIDAMNTTMKNATYGGSGFESAYWPNVTAFAKEQASRPSAGPR